ncbi:MAG: DUF1311 domain-containing protein [Magnetococcales bacterium]|nr:DUF1311 domain-containing protein [Magnetococcales bacterium]
MKRRIENVRRWMPVLLMVLVLPAQSLADEEISIDCAKAMGMVELKYCSGEAYRLADEDLNSMWKSVTAGLEKNFKRTLIEAQRAWITFRDRNCEAETFHSQGTTGYMVNYDVCLERMTRHRTEELRTLLEAN